MSPHLCPLPVREHFVRVMNDDRTKVAWGLIAQPAGVSGRGDEGWHLIDPETEDGGDIAQYADGRVHLDNQEYSGPIFYCPWCGERLWAETVEPR